MVNLKLGNLVVAFIAFVLSFALFIVLPSSFKEVNFLTVPITFTLFVVLVSKLGKVPIKERRDVTAIVLVMFVLSSLLVLVGPLLGNALSIYSVLLVAIYVFIPHLLLSMIFGTNKTDVAKKK